MGVEVSDDLPLSPEDWSAVIQQAAITTGHADEVIVALESTMSGWRVTVNPVRSTPAASGPVSQ